MTNVYTLHLKSEWPAYTPKFNFWISKAPYSRQNSSKHRYNDQPVEKLADAFLNKDSAS